MDDEDFARFWRAYPRKLGKLAALKAWKTALRIACAKDIIDGLYLYPFRSEAAYQPHASTWLRAGNWMIEGDTPPPTVIVEQRRGGGALDMFERALGIGGAAEGRLL